MWRWTSGETRANVLRETASQRSLSPLIRTPIWTVFHARAAFQELSQLPQLHPDRVLMRRRDAGVEADAREWADLAFGVAKNLIARVSILAMTVAVVPEAQAPKNGRFIAAEAVPGVTPGRSHTDP